MVQKTANDRRQFTKHGRDCRETPGGTPYNGLYGEAPPERGTFFRLQVHERVGILLVEVYERVWKSAICLCQMVQRANRRYVKEVPFVNRTCTERGTFFVKKWFIACERALCMRKG